MANQMLQSGLLPTPLYQGAGQTDTTSRSLYIGNLHTKVTEALLYEIFSTIGPVAVCKTIKDKNGISAGYGFVDYYDHHTANLALTHLNGRRIYGQEIKINWAHAAGQKEDISNHYHIFVGDLSPEIDDQALHKAFSIFGSISDARVMWDQNTGKSRGYGFVAFRKKEDAERALSDMNGEWLGGRAIRCNWANQKITGTEASMDFNSVVNASSPTNTTVYVGNLASDANEHILRSVFLEYGFIEEIRIQNSNPEKVFGFIKYANHDGAAKAIFNVNGKIIGSKAVKCSWGKEKGQDSASGTSIPGILSPNTAAPPTTMSMPPPVVPGLSPAAPPPSYVYPQAYVYPNAAPYAYPTYPGQSVYPQGYYYPTN